MPVDKEYSLSLVVPIGSSDEYKQYLFLKMKNDMGNRLYSILEQFQSPCVVEISEEIIPMTPMQIAYLRGGGKMHEGFSGEKIEFKVRLYPIEYKHIVITKSQLKEELAVRKFFLDDLYLKFRKWFMRGRK